MSIFQEIRELAGNEPRSYSWYRDTVRMKFQSGDLHSDMSEMEEAMIPTPGELYMFEYKATYAAKLKFYDEFPLVYVLSTGPKFSQNFSYVSLSLSIFFLRSEIVLLTRDDLIFVTTGLF